MDMTQILGFLILAGFALVMAARWLSKRQQQGKREEEEIRLSTEQLKAEMERSADAVISRLGSHIKHLEQLVQEADERNRTLETQLAQARQAEADLARQSRQLAADIQDARRVSQDLAARWQAQPSQISPLPAAPMPAGDFSRQAPQPPVERVDAQAFAAVLQKSMERDGQMPEEIPAPPPASIQQAAGLAEAMSSRPAAEETGEEAAQPDTRAAEPAQEISPNAAKARALLLSGYSVEETARETGIGKGAIELLREMSRHELDKT